jgi:hypothetical protein
VRCRIHKGVDNIKDIDVSGLDKNRIVVLCFLITLERRILKPKKEIDWAPGHLENISGFEGQNRQDSNKSKIPKNFRPTVI